MKKSVFNLTKKEFKAIDKEMRKISYFKQYYLIYILSILLLIFAGMIGVLVYCEGGKELFDEKTLNIILSCAIILLGFFASLMALISGFKRFDLVKKYYDEVKKGE